MTCDRLERDHLLGHLGERIDPHLARCKQCRELYEEYERIADELARESTRPLPCGWKKRTLARLGLRRRRTTILPFGLAIAAAAAVLLFFVRPFPPRSAVLVYNISQTGDGYRGSVHPGNTLHVAAHADSSEWFEVRIYHESRTLVARCPWDAPPVCRRLDAAVEVSYRLMRRGQYQIVLVVSPSPLPPPHGDLDSDVRAARAAGGRVARSEAVDVF